MKIRQEKNSCWMEDEEGSRRTHLGRQSVGVEETSRCLRGDRGLGSCITAAHQAGWRRRDGAAPQGDPPAGAAGAVRKNMIALLARMHLFVGKN